MPGDLDGRVALITGAGSGLGRATALELAARGAAVGLVGLGAQGLAETATAVGGLDARSAVVECDLADARSAATAALEVRDRLGSVSVLVNNAAIYPYGPWDGGTVEEWDQVMHVNVRAAYLLARATAPDMRERGGGAIVNVSSVTFFTGAALLLSYVTSKAALIGFTRSLARELGPEGIRVNAVAPGAFPTAATEFYEDQDAVWAAVLDAQALKRRGEPVDVARAVAFLAGDQSSFITGQALLVDGGWAHG